MDINLLYEKWCKLAIDDSDLVAELQNMTDDEKNDAFYRELDFGTAGLRGIIGAGTNRMNIYVVMRATEGFSEWIKTQATTGVPTVAISYDSRKKSELFAKISAAVCVAKGIKVYIYRELMPTPMLSYAVTATNSTGGIMITASHNPAKYNGYKAYNSKGCQLNIQQSEEVINEIKELPFFNTEVVDFDTALAEGKIEYISNELIDKYFEMVKTQSLHCNTLADSNLKIVYTPLNGTGNKPVRRIINYLGINDVTVVPVQENPDPEFTTCPYPNPEIREALEEGIKLLKEKNADLLLATDPDADRTGMAVLENGEPFIFNGNQIGALLTEYLCSERTKLGKIPKNPVLIKTIVTTDLIFDIGKAYGCEVIEPLTGFKFIGEILANLAEKGESDRFVFAFEESFGYLAGFQARDKDSVVASMLVCEMTAFYKKQGITLLQALDNLYKKYGYYVDCQESFQFEGAAGMRRMAEIMREIRKSKLRKIGDYPILKSIDYINDVTGLPLSNVLSFKMENSRVIIRPSGTEPKIKVYYSVKSDDVNEAKEITKNLQNFCKKLMGINL